MGTSIVTVMFQLSTQVSMLWRQKESNLRVAKVITSSTHYLNECQPWRWISQLKFSFRISKNSSFFYIGNESEIKTSFSKNEYLASFSSVYLLTFYLRWQTSVWTFKCSNRFEHFSDFGKLFQGNHFSSSVTEKTTCNIYRYVHA